MISPEYLVSVIVIGVCCVCVTLCYVILLKRDVVLIICFFGVFFQKIGQKGRPGGREPLWSISFDETSRMVSVWGRTEKITFVIFVIVRGVSCVLLGSTEAALMGNFTPVSRRPAKCAMRIAWVHSGALRAPLCIQGDVMAHFAGRREIGVSHESSLSRPHKHKTRAPDYTFYFLAKMLAK